MRAAGIAQMPALCARTVICSPVPNAASLGDRLRGRGKGPGLLLKSRPWDPGRGQLLCAQVMWLHSENGSVRLDSVVEVGIGIGRAEGGGGCSAAGDRSPVCAGADDGADAVA